MYAYHKLIFDGTHACKDQLASKVCMDDGALCVLHLKCDHYQLFYVISGGIIVCGGCFLMDSVRSVCTGWDCMVRPNLKSNQLTFV